MSKKRNKQDKPQGTETENDNTLLGEDGKPAPDAKGQTDGGKVETTNADSQPSEPESPETPETGSGGEEEPARDEAESTQQSDASTASEEPAKDSGDNGQTDSAPQPSETETESDEGESEDVDAGVTTDKYKTAAANVIHRRINTYAVAMHPTQTQTPDNIRFQQRELLSIFNTVLKQDEAFKESMQAVISTVREHRKGAFREPSVFRGMNNLGLGGSRTSRFDQLINLFLAAADSKNPKEVSKVIDLKTFYGEYLKDDEAQARLDSYFGE